MAAHAAFLTRVRTRFGRSLHQRLSEALQIEPMKKVVASIFEDVGVPSTGAVPLR
jgi:hypothetical protein